MNDPREIISLDEIGSDDLDLVGGKNVGIGKLTADMKRSGIDVPPGFAISADVYRQFIGDNDLKEPIAALLAAFRQGRRTLSQTGADIRARILKASFSVHQIHCIESAYRDLCELTGQQVLDVAVRSSATAEDLPEASFAGQQESYLNVRGESELLVACKQCFASLYTDRAITYRDAQGFGDAEVALSICVQQMVRSDLASAGVMFTLDTETGFPDVILITGSWGLGETVVKGSVVPDRYLLYTPFLSNEGLVPIIEKTPGSKLVKMIYADQLGHSTATVATDVAERQAFTLTDTELLKLARWGAEIAQREQCPMDIEWAKDGRSGDLFIVQARPETVESRQSRTFLETYSLKKASDVLLEGTSVGHAIVRGPVFRLNDPGESEKFPAGSILVAERTDPDWVPVMQKAAGIITDTGGATSHAAIVSRELKVPAIVGTGNATSVLLNDQEVTLDCSQGATAFVYQGLLDYEVKEIDLESIPETDTELMINAAMPDASLSWWRLPIAGIGLARIEFIISNQIRIHPMALLHPERITNESTRLQIQNHTAGYETPKDYFVDRLALGIGKIAASMYPKPVIVRMSDFKSNEYRSLIGGEYFEIVEENPMLGLRGASRYYHPAYKEAFGLECSAIKKVRETMGFDNVIVMIPFCRTPAEADKVLKTMQEAGLPRGEAGLQVYVMCEIPSNIILAEQFAERFDGFSIGSNDLTQLVLGIDRDSAELNQLFDAGDEAVKRLIAQVIKIAHQYERKVGFCGQAPSDNPEFAEFLVDCGIDSISLNPDSLVNAAQRISQLEQRFKQMG